MSKGLQWVIGISVVVLVAAFAFNLVAPFFIIPASTGVAHPPMMAGMMGNMMQNGAMMQGGPMMGNMMTGGWGLPFMGFMGGGFFFLALLLAVVGLLGFWLGRRSVAQPVMVKEQKQ